MKSWGICEEHLSAVTFLGHQEDHLRQRRVGVGAHGCGARDLAHCRLHGVVGRHHQVHLLSFRPFGKLAAIHARGPHLASGLQRHGGLWAALDFLTTLQRLLHRIAHGCVHPVGCGEVVKRGEREVKGLDTLGVTPAVVRPSGDVVRRGVTLDAERLIERLCAFNNVEKSRRSAGLVQVRESTE